MDDADAPVADAPKSDSLGRRSRIDRGRLITPTRSFFTPRAVEAVPNRRWSPHVDGMHFRSVRHEVSRDPVATALIQLNSAGGGQPVLHFFDLGPAVDLHQCRSAAMRYQID
jgi:hypothetical protein